LQPPGFDRQTVALRKSPQTEAEKQMAKKSCRSTQAAGSGRFGDPVAPDWSGTWSARHQHHGILQGDSMPRPRKWKRALPIPVVITYYQDKSFNFVMKKPPVSYFLKKEAKLKSGSKSPGKEMCRLDHARPGPRRSRKQR
jgi:hypothetical protein